MDRPRSSKQNLASSQLQNRSFGLYIHWPFCRKKCPYCDFNSHVNAAFDEKIFGDALLKEMTFMASLVPERPPLSSLFFGGGTPSLMPPQLVERLITHAQNLFGFTDDIEVSAEANPTSVEAKAILEFRQAGVNRVSIGVQSLDDTSLKFLGREHSVADALAALDTVRTVFEKISVDLIYALPNQSEKAWHAMLGHALSLGLEHLSLYQLTIETGTIFHTRQRSGEVMALDDDRAADLYEITQDMTSMAGLPAYEISNHAVVGQECRHNVNYWKAGDWIGIGPGAHGRFTVFDLKKRCLSRTATITRRSPIGWLDAVKKLGHGIETKETDTPRGWANEMVMMGLRLREAIHLNSIRSLCGPVDNWLDFKGINHCVEAGWLCYDRLSSCLVTTSVGRLRLDYILSIILR